MAVALELYFAIRGSHECGLSMTCRTPLSRRLFRGLMMASCLPPPTRAPGWRRLLP